MKGSQWLTRCRGIVAGRAGTHLYGEDHYESYEHEARRIIATELKPLGWTPVELARRRKR